MRIEDQIDQLMKRPIAVEKAPSEKGGPEMDMDLLAETFAGKGPPDSTIDRIEVLEKGLKDMGVTVENKTGELMGRINKLEDFQKNAS
jgi:hypothetical protein